MLWHLRRLAHARRIEVRRWREDTRCSTVGLAVIDNLDAGEETVINPQEQLEEQFQIIFLLGLRLDRRTDCDR